MCAGVPLYELDLGIAFVVLCLFVGGLVPSRFIYKSVTAKPLSIFEDIPALFGRLSCIGLGLTIATEAITGKVRAIDQLCCSALLPSCLEQKLDVGPRPGPVPRDSKPP